MKRYRRVECATALAFAIALALFIGFRSSGSAASTSGSAGFRLVFRAAPTNSRPVTAPALNRAVAILRERYDALFPGVRVARAGEDVIVSASGVHGATRARLVALTTTGKLAIYDWEADALTATGTTVAAGLRQQNPSAMQISQGSASHAPGYPDAGSMALHNAVSLAARNGRTAVVQAIAAPMDGALYIDGQFYVLRRDPVLSGTRIVDPVASTDETGNPDLQFSFTRSSERRFERLTAVLAHRGAALSRRGPVLFQHFAVAIDNHLISVPALEFHQYPNGIQASGGSLSCTGTVVKSVCSHTNASIQLGGGYLTRQSAQTLAVLMRYGPLPVQLALR
jgi:preprotein translocase subunit SecD